MNKIDFDKITDENIDTLITEWKDENNYIEYKRDTFDVENTTSDKLKFKYLKEMSAFSNSDGGVIIIGIDDVAKKFHNTGITSENFQKWEEWFTNIVTTNSEPPITNFELKPIYLKDYNFAVVLIKVLSSTEKPHQVKTGNGDAFYERTGSSSKNMPFSQIKNLMNDNQYDAVKKEWYSSSIQKISKEVKSDNPLFTFHVYPDKSFSGQIKIDTKKIAQSNKLYPLIYVSGDGARVISDGAECESRAEKCLSKVIIRNNALLESYLLAQRSNTKRFAVTYSYLENELQNSFLRLYALLVQYDVPFPWNYSFRLFNAMGYTTTSPYDHSRILKPINENEIAIDGKINCNDSIIDSINNILSGQAAAFGLHECYRPLDADIIKKVVSPQFHYVESDTHTIFRS